MEELECSRLLLDDASEYIHERTPTHSPNAEQRKTGFYFLNLYAISFHILIFITYSIIFFIVAGKKPAVSLSASELLPLPAREAVKWELRPFNTALINNPFAGAPRVELERAWHNLVKNDHIKIPHDALKALNLKSVQLQDGTGDIASLGTFHAIHCLKKIRQMTYKEHYHYGKDASQMLREQAHSDHCVEYIREYLMCKPDLSLVTLHWINNTAQHADDPSRRLPTSWDHSLHECANWEILDGWAGDRVFDLYQYSLLRQPEDGLN